MKSCCYQEHLDAARLTQDAARECVLQLISKEDYLVGHAVYHDLSYLKIAHPISKIVDTAYLFHLDWAPARAFPLADVYESEVGKVLSGHDSACDAIGCLELVLHLTRKGYHPRSACMSELPPMAACTLFINGIPSQTKEGDIISLFRPKFSVRLIYPGFGRHCPSGLTNPLRFDEGKRTGATRALFKSRDDAIQAFTELPRATVHATYDAPMGGITALVPLHRTSKDSIRVTLIGPVGLYMMIRQHVETLQSRQ